MLCASKRGAGVLLSKETSRFFDKYSCLFGCIFIFKSTDLPCLCNNTLHMIQINMFNFKIRHLNNDYISSAVYRMPHAWSITHSIVLQAQYECTEPQFIRCTFIIFS